MRGWFAFAARQNAKVQASGITRKMLSASPDIGLCPHKYRTAFAGAQELEESWLGW